MRIRDCEFRVIARAIEIVESLPQKLTPSERQDIYSAMAHIDAIRQREAKRRAATRMQESRQRLSIKVLS